MARRCAPDLWRRRRPELPSSASPPRHRERLGGGVGAPQFSRTCTGWRDEREKLPVQEVTLGRGGDHLCHFCRWLGARILNDYSNLDKRSSQLVGSRLASWLHKGARG